MVAVVATAVLGVSLGLPALAGADAVNDLLNGLLGGGATPSAGTPGEGDGYTPPLHGAGPHGQGTVGVVDLVPGSDEPLSGDPAGGDPTGSGEDIVAGRSRGEQNDDGTYHGHITLLGLFGAELLGVDTDEGETAAGPLEPLQDVLDQICTGSGNQVCLEVLRADSSTNGSGSTNSFAVLSAQLGTGANSISAGVAESNGNISDDGTCQTAHGDSTVAEANVAGQLTADALESSATSNACNGSAPSQTNDSRVVALNDTGVPVPAEGCADGTPDTEFTPLAPLLAAVCNADDTNGSQTSAPYGVREALSAFALIVPDEDSALAKATGGASESHAVAPAGSGVPGTPGTPGTPGGGGGGNGGNVNGTGNGPNGNAGNGGNGGGAAEAVPGNGPGSLAFTGSDALVLGLLGGALLLGGLLLTASAGTHRRTAS
jgi:hypothetical protein